MRFETSEGPLDIAITDLTIAGWTGRDRAVAQHHVEELAALGVPPPSRMPLFYRVSDILLTQAPAIQVLGDATSGEAEPLLVNADGVLWLGLGSDHTDRALETVSVATAKQACPKPVAHGLWRFSEVAEHLDRLVLKSEIEEAGTWSPYQSGTLAAILPLEDLAREAGLAPGGAVLCGTLPAIGGVRPGRAWRMSLEDPVLGRRLAFEYRVIELPMVA